MKNAEGLGFLETADGENIPLNALASLFSDRLSESKWYPKPANAVETLRAAEHVFGFVRARKATHRHR